MASRSSAHLSLAFVAALAVTPFAARVSAQGVLLSADLPGRIVGDVDRALFSSDGAWIVYSADPEIDQVFHLYSVPADGSQAPTQLEDFPGRLWSFTPSPRGDAVVFQSGGDLYAVPIDGSAGPTRLNDEPATPGFVDTVLISPDGKWVVYAANQDGSNHLFLVPLDGAALPRPLGDHLPFALPRAFDIDPRGQSVVFLTNGELWSLALRPSAHVRTPSGPAGAIRLNAPLPASGLVGSFRITADGRQVVYWGDCERNEQYELFLAPLDGSRPARKLSAPPPVTGRDVESDFALSRDGTRALYRANHGSFASQEILYSVPLDGSRAAVALAPLDGNPLSSRFAIDPSSQRVVFRVQEQGTISFHLYVVPIDGGVEPRRLDPPLVEGAQVTSFQIDPTGEAVLFAADAEVRGIAQLFSASLRAPLLTELGGGLPGSVGDFQLGPDGHRVVVRVYDGLTFQLYALPVGTRNPTPVELGGPPFQRVQSFALDARGERVLSIADRSALDVFELFTQPIDGSAAPTRLNGPLAAAQTLVRPVSGFEFVPGQDEVVFAVNGCDKECEDVGGLSPDGLFRVPLDGSRAPLQLYPPAEPGRVRLDDVAPPRFGVGGRMLYSAGQGGDYGISELYSAPLDASAPPVELTEPTSDYEDSLRVFVVTPDGARVVFNEGGELYAAPVDGSASTIEIAPFDDESVAVGSFALTADGARAVFVAHDEQDWWLYTVAVDGNEAPVRIDGPRPLAHAPVELLVTADGARVVYRLGPYFRSRELWSAPLDGRSAPLSLGQPLAPSGIFVAVQLSPDGRDVLFVADRRPRESGGGRELFRVPVDGSAAPVRLSGRMVAGGNVGGAQYWLPLVVGAGSRWVVYEADQERDQVVELFATPLHGGAKPIRISRALPPFADVLTFQLAPDESRVVYVADANEDEVFELFSVPVDGSAAPVRLNPPLVRGGDVMAYSNGNFAITPDGSTVLYLADQSVDDEIELFAVPLDGSAPAQRLNAPLIDGGDVFSFRASPDLERVLYLASQGTPYVAGLYASALVRPQRDAGHRR